jgi:hypothetical protein
MMDGETYDGGTGEIVEHRPQVPMRPPAERNLIFASPECNEIFGALAEAQGDMENPKKTKTAKVKGRTKTGGEYEYSYAYAPLDEIVNVIREPLAKAKLIHRQFLSTRGDSWVMRTVIAHCSGQWYGCDYPIFWDESRGMQGFASGVTYARRYGLMMALGLVGEDDDDANVADGNQATVSAGRSGGATAQGSPAPSRSAPARQQAAPAPSVAKADADKRFRELRSLIRNVEAAADLDGWQESLAWEACAAKVAESEVEAGKTEAEAKMVAENAMALLVGEIEKRRRELMPEREV